MALSPATFLRAALLTAALVGPAHADDPRVIRAVPIGDLKVLDPIWTTAYITRNHAYMVWDTLFALDKDNKPQPQMVDRWSVSDDKLTYTFTLRPGLSWHDGAPVLAADCVASLKRWGAKDGMGRALMAVTASIEVVDAGSFKLVLRRPVGFVLDALGKIDSNVPFMMPARIAATDPNAQITEAVGSGPFRFVASAWVPGVKAVYERYPGYVPRTEPPSQAAGGKVAHIDRVELLYMPDASVATNALLKGEVDVLESPAPDLVPLMRKSPDVVVTPNDPLGYALFMVLNHQQPPFDKKDARLAILAALKQSDFMSATVGESAPWRECVSVFGCSGPATPLPPPDLDRARALLKQSGYDGRKVAIFDPADNATLHPGALVAADLLQRIGFNVDLQVMDWSTLTVRRASKNPVADGGWNGFVTNATITGISNPLLNTFAKNCAEAWYGWPCDERIVTLANAWSVETDAAKRAAILSELEKLHLENVTYVPLGQYQSVIAYRKAITGIIPGPALFYWNVAKQ